MEEAKKPKRIIEVIRKMEALGIYKPEFDETIKRYVELREEHRKIYAKYKKSGFECEVQTSQGTKKAPIVATLESLRKDLLTLEESLGLTPRGLLKMNEKAFEKPKGSKTGGLI